MLIPIDAGLLSGPIARVRSHGNESRWPRPFNEEDAPWQNLAQRRGLVFIPLPPPPPRFGSLFFLYIRPSFVTGLYNRVKESFFCVVLHFPVGFFCYPITTISSSARLFSFYNFVNIVFSSFSIVTSQQLLILRLT